MERLDDTSFSVLRTMRNAGEAVASSLHRRCDSDGTQTHDLQNRNLTLYSTELPSQKV